MGAVALQGPRCLMSPPGFKDPLLNVTAFLTGLQGPLLDVTTVLTVL
jgi:hypothetical protein